ncbi:MAG: GTP cyclohydrolase II [archaeon]
MTKADIQQQIVKNKNLCMDKEEFCVEMRAVANLPSRFGKFLIVAFYNNKDEKEHAAIVHGDVVGKEGVPVRIHSECLTGDVLGSLRCDCRDQLETALRRIGKMKNGIVLYLRQEGRGIGFINKIKAYALQEKGLDTIDANLKLGFKDDERDYTIAAHMLRLLGVKSIQLITNNPKKIEAMQKLGIAVKERIPVIISPNKYNKKYLRTKEKKSGHWLHEQ